MSEDIEIIEWVTLRSEPEHPPTIIVHVTLDEEVQPRLSRQNNLGDEVGDDEE